MPGLNLLKFSPALEWLELLTHLRADEDPLQLLRQKFFVATRLGFGLAALTLVPPWLLVHGVPTEQQSAQFVLALAPLVAIAALKRTGNLRLAQGISICGWIALAASVGASWQGYDAVAVTLLAIAVVEAAHTLRPGALIATTGFILVLLALGAMSQVFVPGAATRLDEALRILPLLLYLAALSAEAIVLEQAHRRSECRTASDLRLFAGALEDIVLRIDRFGAVSALIGDAHKAYELGARELLGRGFFQRVHITDRPAFLKLVSDATYSDALGKTALRVQIGAVQSDGGYIEPVFHHFEARAHRLDEQARGDEGDAIVLCILRDVTAARKIEAELTEARRESELAAAGKTRILANISHELRTPLNAIIGFSEMLGSPELEPMDPEKRREYARVICSSGRHLHDVVSMILDMSKIESGAMQLFPEPFSLPALIEQCCAMMQLKADQGRIVLMRDCSDDVEDITADKRACKQILLNLLSNAVKFTPPNGKIQIRLRPEGNSILLSVSDDGIGIAAADLAHLGDPFFQASASNHRAYEGTGLGLSVVRGLVGLHGGSIVVESAPKRGTTVTVRLPQDGRSNREGRCLAAKIQTIARHGAAAPDRDAREQYTVKKIA